MSKVGLMLGGGGAKGAYQLGVLKALNEINLLDQIEVISGTSIGAINTCLLMVDEFNELTEVWNIIDSKEIFGGGLARHGQDRSGLYNLTDLYQTLKTRIGTEKITNSKYKGYVTASRLINDQVSLLGQMNKSNLEKEVILLNELNDPFEYVLASASMPIIFGMTKINDSSYIDGGMVDNNPVDPLIKEGCDVVIAISLDNKIDYQQYETNNIQVIDFSNYEQEVRNPLAGLLESLQFSEDKKSEKEKLGYNRAKSLINQLITQGYLVSDNKESYRIVKKDSKFSHIK